MYTAESIKINFIESIKTDVIYNNSFKIYQPIKSTLEIIIIIIYSKRQNGTQSTLNFNSAVHSLYLVKWGKKNISYFYIFLLFYINKIIPKKLLLSKQVKFLNINIEHKYVTLYLFYRLFFGGS